MTTLSTAGLAALAKIRARIAAWEDIEERWSHGSPAWFVGKRQMAALGDNHHGDGRLALWCAAPEGAQTMLIDSEPEHYFVPAYVGRLGWVGVRLDRGLPWSEIAGALERAYETVKAKTAKRVRSRAKTIQSPTRLRARSKTRGRRPAGRSPRARGARGRG
jgi:hypothetical protein